MGGDIKLKKHVEDELLWQPAVDEASIGVRVKDGIVTLTGHVRTYNEKITAERAVMRIRGVKALVTELEVSLPGAHERTDEEIARIALDVLKWTAALPKNAVQLKVSNGWVTLRGVVDSQFQKHAAEREVSDLIGVKGVINYIELKPSGAPVTSDIRSGIEAALKRSAEVEAQGIQIEICGSTVILNGTVDSWPERKAAERAAWAAPGVSMVENNLQVGALVTADS